MDRVFCGEEHCNVEPLIEPQKVLMPPLHINLGLIKQFFTALDKESEAFKYLQDLIPKLSEAKVKASFFIRPQIKKIIECDKFAKLLNRKEKTAWNSFVTVIHGYLGNHKAIMSFKVYIFDAHLDQFKENMGVYSKEQGEHFHQSILDFERLYQGQYNKNMMRVYILLRESDLQYTCKSIKLIHF